MNTKRYCDPGSLLQTWFQRIDALEQLTVTQTADINELQDLVSDLEASVIGNVNLSLLLINADKNWLGYDITNVGDIDCNMLTTTALQVNGGGQLTGGLDVLGNIYPSGLVDGVDIAAFKSDYDGKINQSVKTDSEPTLKGLTISNVSSGGRIDFNGLAPLLYFNEIDQTAPAGKYRIGVDGDILIIDHNTALDGMFGTKTRFYFSEVGFTSPASIRGNQIYGNQIIPRRIVSSSTVIQASNDALVQTASATYVKVKEIKINSNFYGNYRMYFKLGSTVNGKFAYARIYKNGVALTPERSTSGTTQWLSAEGPYANLLYNETYEIWAKAESGCEAKITDFRIYFDYAAEEGPFTNTL